MQLIRFNVAVHHSRVEMEGFRGLVQEWAEINTAQILRVQSEEKTETLKLLKRRHRQISSSRSVLQN